MDTLPNELLLDVFHYACEIPGAFFDPNSTSHLGRWTSGHPLSSQPHIPTICSAVIRSTPFLLSRVCRLWTEITSSSNSLWSSIYLVVALNSDKLKALTQLLEEYLRRSAQFPLTILVQRAESFQFPRNRFPAEELYALYATLSRECHRWYNINILHLFSPTDADPLTSCTQLPMLRRASLYSTLSAWESSTLGSCATFLQRSLYLQELSLQGTKLPNTTTKESYLHLTHLSVSSTSDIENWLWDILRHTPRLRWLYLDNLSGDILSQFGANFTTSQPIYMNHLETLIIRDCFAAATVILPYFTATPLLRELRYTNHLHELLPPDSLRKFIARSLCSLRLLELETRKLTPACVDFTLHPLLRHTPMLTTLIIHYIGDYASWSAVAEYIAVLLNPLEQPLHRFIHHSPRGPVKKSILLPHLQHFELLSTARSQSIPAVLEMLSRRWALGSPANLESNSSSLSAENGNSNTTTFNFTKLLSAKIPEQYGGDAMQFLGHATREGMKIEYSYWLLDTPGV